MVNQRSRTVTVTFAGDARGALRAMGQTESGLKRLARTGALAGAAVAAAVAAVGIASVKMAADFDKGMREVNTLLRLPEAQFKTLQGETLELSKQLGIVSTQVVPALYQAISAGVPRENVMEFLTVAGKASIGGVTDLKTAVSALTTATNAFTAQGLTATDAADILFTAVRGGVTTFGEMAASIGQASPLAAALGVSFAETAAAMSTFTLQGFNTAESATLVNAALTALLKQGEKLRPIFEQAGFASAQLAIESVGLQGALELVRTATAGDNEELVKLLGRAEAVKATLGLTGANATKFAGQMEAMGQRTGASTAAFEEMEKATSRLWERIKANLSVALIEVGQQLLPLLNEQMLKFSDWWDENGQRTTDALAQGMTAVADAVGFAFDAWTKYVDALERFRTSGFGQFIGLPQDAAPTGRQQVLQQFQSGLRAQDRGGLLGLQDTLIRQARSQSGALQGAIAGGAGAGQIQVFRDVLSLVNDKLAIVEEALAGKLKPALDAVANAATGGGGGGGVTGGGGGLAGALTAVRHEEALRLTQDRNLLLVQKRMDEAALQAIATRNALTQAESMAADAVTGFVSALQRASQQQGGSINITPGISADIRGVAAFNAAIAAGLSFEDAMAAQAAAIATALGDVDIEGAP